jgi:heme oxygenase (biliverdin-IX-beta and delta-forming)
MSTSTITFHAHLKQATRPQHEALEANHYSVAMMSGTLTPSEYQAMLSRFYGFYAPIEAQFSALAAMLPAELNLEQRRKLHWLHADLQQLNEDPTTIPACHLLTPFTTPEQALGCLYVLEGSTLGGQIISRKLHTTLGYTPEHGARFFASYGEQVGMMWKTFMGILEHAGTSGDSDAIITSAMHTFASFQQWLETH